MNSDYQVLLHEQLGAFLKKISTVQLYAGSVKNNTKKLAAELTSKKQSAEKLKEREDIDPIIKEFNHVELRRFTYMNPYTGQRDIFDFKKTNLDEQLSNLYLYQNRQYQWLLVEVYEFFEDYIEWLYACIGFLNNSFWVASDFGDISISEIKEKDLNWFHSKAVIKKKAPHSILGRFRLKVPQISKMELVNTNNTNYRLAITLIEHFRHIIVHHNGNFRNKDDFIKVVLDRANVGKEMKEYALSYISQFTGKFNDVNVILLLEKNIHSGFMHFDRLNKLIEAIISYSFIINNELIAHLESESS